MWIILGQNILLKEIMIQYCCRRNVRSQIIYFKFLCFVNRDAKLNSPRCEISNVYVHWGSYSKHLGSKKHLDFETEIDLTMPEWVFQERVETKRKKI